LWHPVAPRRWHLARFLLTRGSNNWHEGIPTLFEASSEILVVEDDPVLGDMLRELLADAGYQAHWAQDVIGALSALEHHPIDLITLDIELGTYSGRGLLALLKADPRTRDIPVIVISSCQLDPGMRRLAEHVLSKPFNIAPLLQMVDGSIGSRRVAHIERWPEAAASDSIGLGVAREILD
jgi:CheY-like chemotaxis protein